jgi:hypothetical protein
VSWEDSIGQYGIFLDRHSGTGVLLFCLGQRTKDCGGEDSTSFTGIIFIYLSCFFPASRRRKGGVDRQAGIGGAISISGIMINATASGNAMKYFFLGIKCSFCFLLVLCIWAGVLSVFAFAFTFSLHLANGLGKRYFIFRFITALWLVVFLQLGAF